MVTVALKEETRPGILPPSPRLRLLILSILALMAVVSLTIGIKQALTLGIDFQWSGTRILVQHHDPWKTYLDVDPDRQIIKGQQPNYLPVLYLVLWPLGKMSFAEACRWWCAANLLFLAGSIALLRKTFHLDRDHTLLVTFLILSSTPLRTTLANGQHGLFVLFMLSLFFYAGRRSPTSRLRQGIALGFSYGKYSFAPVIVFALLLRRRFKLLLLSAIPVVAALLIVWRMVGGNLLTLAFEPLAVSKLAEGPGSGDLMTLVKLWVLPFVSPGATFLVPVVTSLLAAIAAAVWIAHDRRMEDRICFAVSIILTLGIFVHVFYDYVTLLVVLSAIVAAVKSRARTVAFVCMLIIFYGGSILNPLRPYSLLVPIYFTLLAVLTAASSQLRLSEQPKPEVQAAL